MGITQTPPESDEIEVSLFGPGLGEAVALHLGAGEWMLIDSCIDHRSGRPMALAYLESMGVNPSRDVKLVVATHWHDDHIGGLAVTLEACESAAFWCSAALRPTEFLTLVEALRERALMASSGVSELAAVIDILRERKDHQARFPSPHFALADRRVWRRPSGNKGPVCTVTALSPSDASLAQALIAIGELIPSPDTSKRRVSPPSQNQASIALWVRTGKTSFLLGADVEETGRAETGWRAILSQAHSLDGQAEVFKIPHHGSGSGHNSNVWTELLTKDPIAMLTPFQRGSIALPTPADRQRICELTPHAYISSDRPPSRQRRQGAVEKTIERTVRWIQNADPAPGQIRARKGVDKAESDWQIKLLAPAAPLCDRLAA